MNPKDIENLIKQRYSKMSDEDKEVIRDMYYSDIAGPVLRRFMGGAITNGFKLRKPKNMRLGSVVAKAPRVIGGYDPNAKPQETVADDRPFEGEEGDYIINAAAVEFAGKQDIETMVSKALTNLQEKGVDVEFGNPRISMRDKVDLLLSKNEVYIPKVLAKEIGYDRLEKINNRGKRRTQEIQKQTQQKAYLGGSVKMASGNGVTKAGASLPDILRYFGIGGQGDLPSEKYTPRPKKLKEDGFIPKPPVMPEGMRQQRDKETEILRLTEGAINLSEGKIKTAGYIPKYKSGKVIGISGVTIGRGVDLGQHSAVDLKRAGFTNDLIKRFKPYLGLKKEAAQKALSRNPLNISSDEAKFISDQMLQYKIDEYNRIFKSLKDVPNPRVKAVLVAEHFAGRLGTKDYKKFRQTLVDTNYNLEQAYRIGVFENPKIKGSVYKNAAENLLTWFNEGRSNVVEKPLPKPSQVKPKTKEKALPKPKPEGFIKQDSYGNPMTDQGFRA
tara:strand:- start:3 stop:1499 length:1497 start_codon:yes stop_codon:yes gene_type:complete